MDINASTYKIKCYLEDNFTQLEKDYIVILWWAGGNSQHYDISLYFPATLVDSKLGAAVHNQKYCSLKVKLHKNKNNLKFAHQT